MLCEEQAPVQDEGKFNAAEVDEDPQLTIVLSSEVVLRNLECEYGLLDELLLIECLTEDMIRQISSVRDPEERNAKLVTFINQSNLEKFLTGLRNVQQEHLAIFIVRNGERDSDCEDWPIDDIMLEAINVMQDKFVHEISQELQDELFSQGCISELHRRAIDIKPTREERNMELLTIIIRRGDSHLTKFLKCLDKDHKDLINQLNRIKDSVSLFHIRGLTVVNNELFVVRDGQSKVNVYDSHSLKSSRDISIQGMKSPEGLAGCAHNKALYISDSHLDCIHRVDLTNYSVDRWTMKEVYMLRGPSVTAEHKLLVTVRTKGKPGEYVVEYTSDGEQVQKIRLNKSIMFAHQTVQLSSNEFIVCHGGSDLHRVCKINAACYIIKSYGSKRGAGKRQLDEPRSLTIDNKSKHIFVADTWNNRILLFDFELTYLGQVHTSRDLNSPTRLCFDSFTDRLFVGEESGSVIVIYSPTV